MPILDTILQHAAMCEQWTLCTVDDVPDEQWAEQPGGLPNHPAWVLGHLVLAMDTVARRLGAEVPRDESWYEPFLAGTEPVADRSAYPSREELVSAFGQACRGLRTAVRAAGEAGLDRPTDVPEMAVLVPTIGQWALHVLVCETAFHTGQLSSWRRVKGLPSVFEQEANQRRMVADALEV